MFRKPMLTLVAGLLLVFTAACGGNNSSGNASQPGSAPATGQASPAEPTAVPAPKATEPPPAAAERSFKDVASLDVLDSYRMSFKATFDGTEKGEPRKGTIAFVQEFIKASKDQRFRVTSDGNWSAASGNSGTFEMIQIGETSYMFSPGTDGKQQCVGFSGGDQAASQSNAFKPETLVGTIEKAKLAGRSETINGIVSDHYTVSEGGGLLSSGEAKGDIWVAQDGGYLVKYIGNANGKGAMFGDGEGAITWEYNLEEVNKLSKIEIPKECEGQGGPAVDIPFPATATDKAGFGGMQTFKTSDAPADVAAFYKKELPAQGWKAGAENTMGDLVTLEFTKESRKLSITITKDEKGTSVMINEDKGA